MHGSRQRMHTYAMGGASEVEPGRYLLYDHGCGLCSRTARAISDELGTWLRPLSLGDQRVQEYLTRTHPRWSWEPMILDIGQNRSRLYRGLAMRVCLLRQLGLRRSFRVVRLIVNKTGQESYADLDRRDFLKKALIVLGAPLAAPWLQVARVFSGASAFRLDELQPTQASRLSVVGSKEVSGGSLEFVAARILAGPDVAQLARALERNRIQLNGMEKKAVVHQLSDGTSLLSFAASDGRFLFWHLEFSKPVANVKTRTTLLELKGNSLQAVESVVNGHLGTRVGSMASECGGCVDPIEGSWSFTDLGCSRYDWLCFVDCCGPCAVACAGGGPTCLACVAVWCVYCSLRCCAE